MKKFFSLSSVVALLAIIVFLGAAARGAAQDPVPALAASDWFTPPASVLSAYDAPALPAASPSTAAALFATKPDAPFAVLALAIALAAILPLARGVGGAKLSLTGYLRLAAGMSLHALDRMIAAVFPSFHSSRCLGVDAWTRIADLWVPEVLAQGMAEPVVERTAFLDSGVVATSTEINKIADGPGTEVTIPFLIEPNHDDQLQTQDTAPDIKRMTSGTQKAAAFNRVSTLGMNALSQVVSGVNGGDLLQSLVGAIQGLRKRQRNRLVLKQLSGLFAVTATPDQAIGPFRALRKDAFLEAGAAPASGYLIDSTKMLQATALLGENNELLVGGAIVMHSAIASSLVDQDQIDVIKNSEGEIVMRRWKGMQVFLSDLLVRAGATSGLVYYTFFCARGSIAMGDKPQVVTDKAGPVAALQLDMSDIAKNNVAIYDRTRFILHPQGAKWDPENGVPANTDAGPSNAEVADYQNWALGANDIKNTRIVCLRTNG